MLNESEGALTEVVRALNPSGRFADILDRGKEKTNEYGDHPDHNQEFDQ